MTSIAIGSDLLSKVPQVELALAPTPLQEVSRLAKGIGLERLWVKRDDNTGLALGGNKARKLDFIVGHALEQGADILLTMNGPQSNHCRMTAAAAAQVGIDCRLVFTGKPIDEVQGNMILDRLVGATWEYGGTFDECQQRLEVLAEELRAEGRHPYIVPPGGMNGRGTLGYMKVAYELAEQFEQLPEPPKWVFAAAGSCSTVAGLALGFAIQGLPCHVVGISTSAGIPDKPAHIAQLIAEACEILGIEVPDYDARFLDDYLGEGYGRPTPESTKALELAAKLEGIILDPVYTAKSFSGLMGEIAKGTVAPTDTVVYMHTGGAMALFADRDLYWPAPA
jgi:D-cysteine desulfhydrase family pyridoxal phosphate-dependent enzyme